MTVAAGVLSSSVPAGIQTFTLNGPGGATRVFTNVNVPKAIPALTGGIPNEVIVLRAGSRPCPANLASTTVEIRDGATFTLLGTTTVDANGALTEDIALLRLRTVNPDGSGFFAEGVLRFDAPSLGPMTMTNGFLVAVSVRSAVLASTADQTMTLSGSVDPSAAQGSSAGTLTATFSSVVPATDRGLGSFGLNSVSDAFQSSIPIAVSPSSGPINRTGTVAGSSFDNGSFRYMWH